MYPRQSSTTHTEQLGDEASVYDWAHAQVHALNPTAARVWRLCDGATSPDAIAAALQQEMGIPEADAVVDLTLKELARLHLLELPVEPLGDRPAPTRRWLLGRGLAAAMLPAIYTILAPSPLEAQSPGAPRGAPTLASVSPNQGTAGTTVAVTLTGTNFVAGATTVTVGGGGVTVNNVVGGQRDVADRQLRDRSGRSSWCPHGDGHDGRRHERRRKPSRSIRRRRRADADERLAESRHPGHHGGGHADRHQLRRRRHDGERQRWRRDGQQRRRRQHDVADRQLRARSGCSTGARTVTVTTAGGTSGGQTFTINVPPGSTTFTSRAVRRPSRCPPASSAITIVATGAQGGMRVWRLSAARVAWAVGRRRPCPSRRARRSPCVSVALAQMASCSAGGFNGGGGSTGNGGGGGGASSVHDGATPLVIAGGGGGGGLTGGGASQIRPAGTAAAAVVSSQALA